MYLERFTDKAGDLFIKFPLISNLINERGWRATEEANQKYAYSAIGKPLTLMFDKRESMFNDFHPFDPNAPMTDRAKHIEFANKYAYGQIVDVSKSSSSYKSGSGEIPWFGIAKITDPTMAEEWKKPNSRLVPPAFSPGIVQLEGPDDAITKYEILHVASVPSGAFGPKFVAIGKCEGDLTTCTPQLRAASYREKTGKCPIEVFSSLLAKSGSSGENNNMSFSSNAPSTPSPQAFGTAEVKTPGGETMATQNVMPTATKSKPTIYIKKLRFQGQGLNQSTEPQKPNGEQPEGGEGNGGETSATANPNMMMQQQLQQQSDPNADRAFRSSIYYQKMKNMEKQLQDQKQQWDYKEKRYQLEKIIKPSLFVDGNNKFQQKAWEHEIETAIKENVSLDWLKKYYANMEMLKQVPEIKTKRASSPSYDGLVTLQGASSLEADEDRIKAEKALRLNGGF